MKKTSCSLIALLATTVAFANTTPIHLLSYTTSNNEVTITGFAHGASSVSNLLIPPTITGLPVTTIGEKAFNYRSSITNAILPASVKTIEFSAFASSNLQSIEMHGIETIADSVFYASDLTSIILPDSLHTIGDQVFRGCTSLATITVDADNPYFKAINNVLFNKSGTKLIRYAPRLPATAYTAPDGIETIVDYAFHNCSFLESITLPDSLQTIGDSAFNSCALTSLTLPASVTSIGNSAFWNCFYLPSITLPASLQTIGNHAFENCFGLSSITFFGNAPSVGSLAFNKVKSSAKVYVLPSATGFGSNFGGLPVVVTPYTLVADLTFSTNSINEIVITGFAPGASVSNLLIPPTINGLPVTTIGEEAFQNASITSAILPASVTLIERRAFYEAALQTIEMPGIETLGFAAFAFCDFTSITLPDSLQTLGNSAFSHCNSLKSVTLPASLQPIDDYAFSTCTSLTSITLPDNLQIIGQEAFSATALTSVTLPDSLQTIGNQAFASCDLTSVTLPASLQTIAEEAFGFCDRLTSITFLGNRPSSLGVNIFRSVASNAKVYVLPGATGFGETLQGLPVVVLMSINTSTFTNDNWLITLNGGTDGITVEETTDLTADNWVTKHNPIITNGAFQFSTTNAHRYYRFSNSIQ